MAAPKKKMMVLYEMHEKQWLWSQYGMVQAEDYMPKEKARIERDPARKVVIYRDGEWWRLLVNPTPGCSCDFCTARQEAQ